MSKRYGKCYECGGIYGHHMTGCPETPEIGGEEIENDAEETNEGDADDE